MKRTPIGPIRPNRSYPLAPAWGYGRAMLARFLATLLLAVIVVAPGARAAETAAVVVDATTAQALSELTTTAADKSFVAFCNAAFIYIGCAQSGAGHGKFCVDGLRLSEAPHDVAFARAEAKSMLGQLITVGAVGAR